MEVPPLETRTGPHRGLTAAAVLIAAVVMIFAVAGRAPAADLSTKLDDKQAELDQAKQKKGVLTTEISRYNAQIDQLTGEVAALRTREAAVQQELDKAEAELAAEQHDLRILRERLDRTIEALEDRLVDIYKADEPTAVSVVLESDGYDDALSRYEYLQRIEDQNSEIVGRVRELRDDTAATVERVRSTRDSIAAKRRSWSAPARSSRPGRASSTRPATADKQALGRVDDHADHLEGDVSDLQDKIQAQLAAASGVPTLPAGPIQGGSAGFIWPVNGPIASPFGERWGDDTRGHRHRGPGRYADPRGKGRNGRLRAVRGDERRLRQLHLHRPRRRNLHLLRPPVQLRDHLRVRPAGRRDRLRRLHRPLLRRSPPLRGPDQRHRRRSDGLPLDLGVGTSAGLGLNRRPSCRAVHFRAVTCNSGSCWTE